MAYPRITEETERFGPLGGKLHPAHGPCPFIVEDRFKAQVEVTHASAGRDATHIQLMRKWDGSAVLADLAVTIRYEPFVEGTAIIYDLLEEMMQGKARPFECNLTKHFVRMYMLLPFQIEKSLVTAHDAEEGRVVEIAFLDARNAIIRAALPLQLRVADSSGKIRLSKYTATNRNGHLRHEVPTESGTIVVRSLLTGLEETRRV